jgi:hypothetical protein
MNFTGCRAGEKATSSKQPLTFSILASVLHRISALESASGAVSASLQTFEGSP